jgi:pyrroline-5-carboxylate reductase
MMQVSAVVRLMPTPPALVERSMTRVEDPGLLKSSMAA